MEDVVLSKHDGSNSVSEIKLEDGHDFLGADQIVNGMEINLQISKTISYMIKSLNGDFSNW